MYLYLSEAVIVHTMLYYDHEFKPASLMTVINTLQGSKVYIMVEKNT